MDSQFQAAPILVVEDEPLIALDIEDSLVALGMPVHVARSLADARGFVARLPLPRLVLLDVVLPDGRSFDFAHELIAPTFRCLLRLRPRHPRFPPPSP
jgi:DNA-binding response OmpR family regulator